MTCREMDAIFAGKLTPEAREHLAGCPQCRALSEALNPGAPSAIDRVALDQTRDRILADLAPVRPMASPIAFAGVFVLLASAVGVSVAALKGFHGLAAMTGLQTVVILSVLTTFLLLAAFAIALEMRPGARTLRTKVLALGAIAAMEAAFLALFRDYTPGAFLHLGLGCFSLGSFCAAMTALAAWIPLRRGYFVAPVSTGASVGALAGLAGLAMLELHCPVLNIPHLVVWHAGVLAASIAAGAGAGKLLAKR